MKAFFGFLGMLLVAGIAFGLYISKLDSCADMAARTSSGFTELECHKLYLAFGVLFAIAIMLALGAGFYAFLPPPQNSTENPGKLVFENFSKIFPPIITLVLGYYFGSSQTAQSVREKPPSQVGSGAQTTADPASSASRR